MTGQQFRRYRENAGLSQRRLASIWDVSHTHIQNIEKQDTVRGRDADAIVRRWQIESDEITMPTTREAAGIAFKPNDE